MSWLDYFTWPKAAISDLQRDMATIKPVLLRIPKQLTAMEARMSELEDQTRVELAAAITGALGAYDAKVAELAAVSAERDNLRAALETADADKAAAVEAAVSADDAGDAAFNAEQVDALRRLQPVVEPPADNPPADEPPVDEPPAA